MAKRYQVTVSHYRTGKRVLFGDPEKTFPSSASAKAYIAFVRKTTGKNNMVFFKNPRVKLKKVM